MRRSFLSTFLLAFFLLTPSIGQTFNWTEAAAKVNKSVIRLTIGNEEGSCTAFSINEKAHFFMSAAHCASVNGVFESATHARLEPVWYSEEMDVMVLMGSELSRPALKAAKSDPVVGNDIMAVGYGWGFDKPLFRAGHVSQMYLGLYDLFPGQEFLVTDFVIIPGMSGGPIVNTKSEVVSVNQLGDSSTIGLGRPISRIYAATKEFWERRKVLGIF